jgi:predicted nucleic acid-binding protein
MIVVDASAGLAALLNAGDARSVLASERLHVPHLIDLQIANGLRRLVTASTLSEPAARTALRTWTRLGLTRYAAVTLIDRVWALRHNLSAYDASYVALAESLGCALVTADSRLSRAPRLRCPVTVVPR